MMFYVFLDSGFHAISYHLLKLALVFCTYASTRRLIRRIKTAVSGMIQLYHLRMFFNNLKTG